MPPLRPQSLSEQSVPLTEPGDDASTLPGSGSRVVPMFQQDGEERREYDSLVLDSAGISA